MKSAGLVILSVVSFLVLYLVVSAICMLVIIGMLPSVNSKPPPDQANWMVMFLWAKMAAANWSSVYVAAKLAKASDIYAAEKLLKALYIIVNIAFAAIPYFTGNPYHWIVPAFLGLSGIAHAAGAMKAAER